MLTPAVIYACGRVDLSVTKSGPGTAQVGQTAVYNFTVTQHDTGRSTGTKTEVRDLIPAGFTYASASGVNCSVSGQNVVCTGIPNLTQNQSHNFSVTFNVTAAACANSPVQNTAVVDARESDTNPSNDTSNTVTTTITGCDADLSISKTGPATVVRGNTISYTAQVTNNGPSDATNVVVTDAVPSGLTFNGGSSSNECSLNGSNVECTVSSLSNGSNQSFTIAFDVEPESPNCGIALSNTATVNSDTNDGNSGNNSSTAQSTITCEGDVTISKSGPATVVQGNTVTYTLTASNTGPSSAYTVTALDAIPTGLTFVAGSSHSDCSVQGSNVVCLFHRIDAGASKNRDITFTVTNGATCGSTISNSATLTTTTPESNAGNNTSNTVTTTVNCEGDLSITKSGPGTATRSSTVSYSVTVTNNGPSDAQGVTISDAVPAGTTFNSGASDASCSLNGSNVLCNNITLTSGESKTLTIAFDVPVDAVCSSTITNVATASSTTTDPVSSNNTSNTVATTVDCSSEQADLSIAKSGPATVSRGSTVSYSIVATNGGPSTANAVTITDPVPAGLTFNSGASDATCTLNGNNVLCNSFSLTNGASKTVVIAFDVPTGATCGATITNVATISTSSVDPNSGNNTSNTVASTVDCSNEQADLSVTKSGPASVQPGNTVSYTVSVTNGGPATANAVTVTDAIPSGLTFNSGSSSSECSQNGSNIECSVSTLANGASKGFTIAFDVPGNATCSSTITNVATVSTTSVDPVSGNNTSQTVSTTVDCGNQADLSVTKSGPSSVTRSSTVSYTVTATNNGPGTANSVTITDPVPAGLTFNSGASDLSCGLNGSNVLCNSFNLSSGQSRTVTISFNVPAGATCNSTISNQATVSSATTDPVSSNNTSQTVSSTVDCTNDTADVRISKSGPSTVLRGNTLSYTVSVTNDGPANAQGVTISDAVPSGLTFNPSASSPNCILNGANVLCNNIALANGQTQNVTIAFDVPTTASCGGTYTNQATASTTSTDPNSANNTSQTVSTTVDCPPVSADLEVVKAGRDRIPRNETLIYMVQALNRGPDEAPDVVITDAIPAGLVFNPSQSHPACQQVGNNVVCTGPALPKDRQWPILIAFDLSASVQCGSFIQNRASVSTSATDPNSSNNQSQIVATFVECPNGNMTIEKSGPSSVLRGDTITYNIVVRNTSPTEVLRNTLVFDQTPANTTFETAGSTPGCFIGVGFTDVYCPAEDIPVGGTRNVTLVFRVENTAPCDSFINNIADVWADNADATWSNELITQVQCLSTETDISVDKTGPGTVTRGNQISYSVTVTNNGLGNAIGVQIADPIPTGLTFNSGGSSNNCSVSGVEVVCNNIDLVNGQSRTLTLVFDVPSTVACNATLQNQARLLSAPQGDPNPNNNLSQVVSTTVNCPAQLADLRISKNGPASVVKGNTVVYTLVATNDGPDTATNITIADTIPSIPHETTGLPVKLVFDSGNSHPSCVSNGSDILCNNFNLSAGQSRTVEIAFSVPTTARCASTILNRASVSASSTDPNSSNNQSQQVSTAVDCLPTDADVSVTKSGPATVTRGNVLTYNLTASNAGPVNATNVVITDTVPTGVTFNAGASSNNCSLNGNTITCTIGNLASGASQSVTLAFDTPATLACNSSVQNYATVSATEPDPNNGNNTSSIVATTVVCPVQQADVSVAKNGPATVSRGNILTYTITATNNGPDTATNVTVTDTVPAGLSFNAGGSSTACVLVGSTVTCSLSTLTSGASQTVSIAFDVPNTVVCNSSIQNSAVVTASQQDPVTGNNTSNTVFTTVECPVAQTDLEVVKAGRDRIPRNETIIYMIQALNRGPDEAPDVQIRDTIPAGLIFNAAQSHPACQQVGNEVVCNGPALPKDRQWPILIAFDIGPSVQCGSFIQNRARVSTTANDPNAANDQSQLVVTFVECPNGAMTIEKSGPTSVVRGNTITYDIIVRNTSPTEVLRNTLVFDQTPANTTFETAGSTPGCFVGTGFTDVYCPAEDIPVGGVRNVTLVFRVNAAAPCGSFISNIADVWADNADATWSNEVITQVQCPVTDADVSVTKSGPATVTRGNILTFNLTASNAGPVSATNVQITDTVPTGVTFNAGASSNNCSLNGNTITCSIGTLASGASQSVTLAFDTPATLACNSSVQNYATVSATEPDPNNGNNTSSIVATTVVCPAAQADISASKSGPVSVIRGNILTYTITVTNNGPDTATNVTVNDTVPTGLVYNSAGSSNTCSLNGNTVTCGVGTLTSGAFTTVTLAFNVPTTLACNSTVQNFAVADLTELDPNSSNNTTNTVTTTVQCPVAQADVSMSKTGPATILRGTKITYTLTATNNGPDSATNVVITDPIPSAQHETGGSPLPLQFEAGDSDPSCSVNGVNIQCSGFSLNAGQSKSVQVVFTVPSQSRCSAFVVNQSNVTSSANDPNSSNNVSPIVSTLIQCPVTDADLTISKVGQPTVLAGNRVSYNITATNNGPATATNVTIADPIPTVINAQSQVVPLVFDAVASDPSCQINGANILCNNFSLTAGQSKTVTVAFTVPATAQCSANILNQATVSGSSTDPNSGNNTSQVVVTTVSCPVQNIDLTIAKMGRDRIPITETLLYTLQAFNRGPDTATNVTFRDQIPAGLVFNANQSDASCAQSGNEIVCSRPTLADNQLWTIVVGFDINPQVAQCNSFISNVATIFGDETDTDPSTNTSNVVQTYIECPGGEVSIVKTGPATALRGDLITYDVLVTNNSAFTIRDASVFDGTPQNTVFEPTGSSPECYVAQGFTDVFCSSTDLAPGEQRAVTLVFRVQDTAPCNGLLSNIADVWSDNADPTWSNQVVTKVLCPAATFDISKTDNRTTVTATEVLNYQISVTNTSTVDDNNVRVVDTLPANVTFVGASDGGIFDGTQVTWNGLSIDAGDTKVLMMTVSVNTGTQNGTILTNNAFVVNGPTAIDQTTVVETITFDISKDDGRTNANAGETLIYTIPVTNTSASDATNVTVTDTLPPEVAFISADNSGTHSNGTVTWSGLSIDAGQTVNLMVTVVINAATPGGTVLTNTAQVLGGPTAIDTTVVNGGQLGCIEIIKETFDTSGQPITPVAQFMFSLDGGTQTTQNDSNGNARFDNVAIGSHTVTETVPPTWTQLSVTPPNGVIQVQPGPTCSTVTFKNQQQLQNPTFTITKTDNRTTVSPGETLVYTVSVTNTSAVNAANVSIRDTLPSNVTFVSADNSGVHTAGVVDWVVPINAGQTVSLAVEVTVNVSTPNGTVLKNNVQILGGPSAIDTTTVVVITSTGCIDVVKEAFNVNGQLINPVPQFSFQLDGGTQSAVNNSLGLARFNNVPTGTHTVTETVPPTWRQVSITPPNGLVVVSDGPTCSTVLFKNQQDLGGPEFSMSKTDGRTTAAPGETLTYTITVENISTKNATGVTVVDTLPGTVAFISADNGGVHSNGSITWNNLNVAGNSSITLTVIAQVNAGLANGTVLTNTASIPNTVTAIDTTTVSSQVPTFTISKTDNLQTATPGQSLTYLIAIQNTSAFNATNVSVTDTLPSQVLYGSSSDGGSINGQIVSWTGLSIAAGQQKTLTVTATVNSSTQNGTVLTNIAQIVNGPSATDTTTVQGGQAQLTIAKTDNRTTAKANDVLTYVITLQNSSSTSASSVSVTDTLPADVTFVSATNGGTANGQSVTWSNLSVNGNSTITLTVQARVRTTAADNTVLTNTVQIVGGLSATDTTIVEGGTPNPNNVTIDLSDDRDPVEPGESFCYTVQVNNLNSVQLTNQTVTQTLDGMTEFQSASDSGSHSSRIITWRNVTLPANGTKTFNSCVRVDEDTDFDERLTSKAFINSQSDTENTRVDDDIIVGSRRCEIQSITDTPDPVKVGDTLTYSIRIRNGRSSTSNSSSSRTDSFDIVAYLDNDTAFMSASDGGDESGGREVEWDSIRLRRGESKSVRITVRVRDTAEREDHLRIRVQCEDDEEYENTRVEGEGAQPPSDGRVRVSIDKRASRQEARPGDMVTYTLTLRNLTDRSAKDVTVEDRFNAGSISIQDSGGGEIAGNGIDWKIASLGPNDTRIFTYRVRVGPDMRHGQIVSNTVIVRSPDLDRPATDIEEVRIITELPQTGGAGFGSSFTDVAQNLRPTTVTVSSSNGAAAMQFILWTSIISMGMLGGSMLGRRFFL